MASFDPPIPISELSHIESALFIRESKGDQPDVYNNVNTPWHPPGARGIFGGTVIAQCLSAAQDTVPLDLYVHAIHCTFVLAGDPEMPIFYHVNRLRDGRSFATRTVQALQRGKCIFTTIVSFTKMSSGNQDKLTHAMPMPTHIDGRPYTPDETGSVLSDRDQPFDVARYPITSEIWPSQKKARRWVRAKGAIGDRPLVFKNSTSQAQDLNRREVESRRAHLCALAYMSDFHFIGVAARAHHITRFAGDGYFKRALEEFQGTSEELQRLKNYSEDLARQENEENGLGRRTDADSTRRTTGMVVSLDHSVYFHNPQAVRANEWMFQEMDSPWADNERGLVTQRLWSKDGVLLATCFQEGMIRLRKKDNDGISKL